MKNVTTQMIIIAGFFALSCSPTSISTSEPPKVGDFYDCGDGKCTKTKEKTECGLMESKGNLSFIDCGQAYDGPAYFINTGTGKILANCGGLLMHPEAPDRDKCSFEALSKLHVSS